VFSGDNGGATTRGVTGDRILVSVRLFEFPSFAGADEGPLAAFMFKKKQLEATISGLFDYFNTRFQLYGRRLEAVFWEGKGDIAAEAQGAGQEGAEADSVKVADEIKPFAELLALSNPYADALARRQVMNFGALYMPRGWYAARRPYSWSSTPDCSFVMESVSDYLLRRVARKPASHAGGDLRDQPRRLALIAPENSDYQPCVDDGERVLRAASAPPALRLAYKLDFNTLSNQAASIAAKLRNARITTVVCGCDPVLPLFLTGKAQEQNYQPEWVVVGSPFIDNDAFGQVYQQNQWSRAFGVSWSGTPQPVRSSYGYFAFKAVRPHEEPIALVDALYYNLYPLALGVQMAGPHLTPETFETGIYTWPGAIGPAGTWRFTPGRYNPIQDGREIYWDPDRTSPSNGNKGTYVESEPGRRYRAGGWPPGEPSAYRGRGS
jgi:hypothetical protein